MGYDDRSVFGINMISLPEKEEKFPFPKEIKEMFYSTENQIKRKCFFMKK